MGRMLLTAVAMTVLAAGVPAAASPARSAAPPEAPLQPGAPLIDQHAYPGAYCSLSFVFVDNPNRPNRSRTYIGTSEGCTTHRGQRAKSPEIGYFGTVVFREHERANFALIEIDPNKEQYVSNVMRGYGKEVTGYTTSDQTNEGDLLVTHGYALNTTGPAITRYGGFAGDSSTSYMSTVQPVILDRGAPVVRVSDGKAVGLSNELHYPVAHATVEGVMGLLRNAGFDVALLT